VSARHARFSVKNSHIEAKLILVFKTTDTYSQGYNCQTKTQEHEGNLEDGRTEGRHEERKKGRNEGRKEGHLSRKKDT
jgi:hypothetical protein